MRSTIGPSSPASETASCSSERVGRESRIGQLRDRLVERTAWDALARLHELRQLVGGHGSRVETGTDDGVGDDVRRLDGARARCDGLVPEPVESTCDEHGRPLEVQRRLDASNPSRRRLGHLRPNGVHELRGGLDGNEVGLGEVAVVVGLLLRASRGERPRPGVEVVRLLQHPVARLPHADLTLDLGLDPARDEVEGVHVLDLRPRAQLVRPGRPHRDVGVDAKRALLHLRIGDPELDDRLAEELEEALRLVGGADVGRRHDLDERRAAAVVVDERGVGAADAPGTPADVDRLRRVLLEVGAYDADHTVAICSW